MRRKRRSRLKEPWFCGDMKNRFMCHPFHCSKYKTRIVLDEIKAQEYNPVWNCIPALFTYDRILGEILDEMSGQR